MTEAVNSGTETTVNPDTETKVETQVETKTDTIINPEVKTEVAPWISNDWRDKLAGGDTKELARLQRFTDINSVYKSYRELEAQVSSGGLKRDVDFNKLDDAGKQEYRKSNGIPETAGDYQLDLPKGTVLSDEDQTILGSVLETMHDQNRKPSEVNEVVNRFLEAREYAQAADVEKQNIARTQAEETLRQEWHGATYLTNLAAAKNYLVSLGPIGEQLMGARLPDGSLAGNNVQFLKAIASTAMELNPAGTVVPGTGADQLKSVQDELGELNEKMRTNLPAWRKDEASRARHRELINAELNLKNRGYA